MSCQNLIQFVKLSYFRHLHHRHIQRHISSSSFSYLHAFYRQKVKCFSRINKCKYNIPSVNIQTSNKYFHSSEEKGDLSQPLVELTFITPGGEEVQIKGRVGLTVMQAAVQNKIPMEGACSGKLCCTTCHVYVEEDTKKFFEGACTMEADMLDESPSVQPNSRLCCQLKITKNLENARFYLPLATTNFAFDGKKFKHS